MLVTFSVEIFSVSSRSLLSVTAFDSPCGGKVAALHPRASRALAQAKSVSLQNPSVDFRSPENTSEVLTLV